MRRRVVASLVMFLSFPILLLCQGCRCGQNAVVVATLVSSRPVTELSLSGEGWSGASEGARLAEGDALRTGERGEAELDIVGHGRIKVAPQSLVRFRKLSKGGGGGPELRLSIENGSLEATVGEAEEAPTLVIDGPTGRLRINRGSRAELAVEGGLRLRLNLTVGTAELEEQGTRRELEPGDELVLRIGEAGQITGVEPAEPDAGARADVEAPPVMVDAAAQAASDQRDEEAFLEDAEGVQVKLAEGARVEVKLPGGEDFVELKGRRPSIAPGATIKVRGAGLVEIVGPGGAAIKLYEGARGVVLGSGEGRLRVRLQGGRGDGSTSGDGTASIAMPGGVVDTGHAGGHSAFRATVQDSKSSRVSVRSGVAVVHTAGQTKRALTGEEVVLRVGRGARILEAREVQPLLRSGSAVIHDPNRSGGFTARFPPIPGCKTYSIQVREGGSRLIDGVTDRSWFSLDDVGYGTYRWEASCQEAAEGGDPPSETRDGRVMRIADRSGHIQIPTKAPRNSLETNGRQYTVLYQNRLPAITLRWSKAPEVSRYRLEVRDEASGRVIHAGSHKRAVNGFRSGFFREGSYYWFFRAEGATKNATSPVTKVRISFDNVFPAIHIAEPQNGAPGSGSVRTRGTCAVGSTVIVNGVQLELGRDYRFDQQVPVGPGGLMIFRVTTPGRGTGLYLRHLSR